jgi:hypothetical protein
MPFAYIFALLLAIVPVMLFRGFVLSVLWGWFVVRLGVPPIGIVNAIGLSFLISFLTYHYTKPVTATKANRAAMLSDAGSSLIAGLSIGVFALLFGYILHFFL